MNRMLCFDKANLNEQASEKISLKVIMCLIRTANRHRWAGVNALR